VGDRYHKLYQSRPPAFEQLSYDAQAFFFYTRGHHIEPDGTIAVVKRNEKIYQAVARTYGIEARSRRRFDGIVTELFACGFIMLVGDRVVVPHWEEQRSWRKGPPPPMRCEPDPATLTRVAHESATTLLDHFSITSPTLVGDLSETSQNFSDTSPESTSRNHSTPFGQSGSKPVGWARIGSATQSPPLNLKARGGEGSGAAEGSQGSEVTDPSGSDGAPVVDVETGEVIDPDDFYDPPLGERERQHAELPPDEVTPEEADEAAELFDDVEEEGAL
jgi:hypothetical protein